MTRKQSYYDVFCLKVYKHKDIAYDAQCWSDLSIFCLPTYTTVAIDLLNEHKGPAQSVLMHRLIWSCFVCRLHKDLISYVAHNYDVQCTKRAVMYFVDNAGPDQPAH